MVNDAKKSITIVTTKEDLQKWMGLLKGVKQNGVTIEIGLPSDAPKIKNNGFKIRKVDIKARFMSIDRQKALFMINDSNIDPNNDTGVLVKSEFFTSALDNLIKANMR